MSTQRLIAFLSILIVIALLLCLIVVVASQPALDKLDGAVIAMVAGVLGALVREVGNLLPRDEGKSEDKD